MGRDALRDRIIKDILTGEDGFKVYWPADFPGGAFTSYSLRQIADILDELNEDWSKEIEEYFSKNKLDKHD